MRAPGAPILTWEGRKPARRPPPARLTSPRASPGGPPPSGDESCCLIQGDNLQALAALAEEMPQAVTLAYLDPPFLTGREHFHIARTKQDTGLVLRQEQSAFDDRWSSLNDYLEALEGRLRLIFELLAPQGSMVLHVDPKTSHYLKILCDEIFGAECFASEIIWRYRRWPAKTRNFQRVHDVLLRYVKDPTVAPRFNQLYEPLAPSTQKTWGDRKQRAVTDDSGRRLRSSKTAEKSRGTPLGDVWEIGIVAPVARERTGYPTQKPEALLRRLIEACSNPDDLVLDPYMGSGTTLNVACQLGRRALGIDVGHKAHSVTQGRLNAASVGHVTREVLSPLAKGRPRRTPPGETSKNMPLRATDRAL
jgi:DNA modification methylase